MSEAMWEPVWERVRSGRHTVLVGVDNLPPAPSDLKALQTRCDTHDALDQARHQVERLLGDDLLTSNQARERLLAGLRHRLLDVAPVRPIDAVLVEECNRLADWSEGRAVLCLEAVDAADPATLETLAEVMRRPGWLRLPLILTLRSAIPEGPAAELIKLLRATEGPEAFIDIGAAPVKPPSRFDWTALPAEVLRILRAGSVIGATFEAGLIARLLDEPPGAVLEKLQWAADAGAPLADRGEGRFSLPPEAVQMLQSRMLPSLLSFWHERLGRLLGEESRADAASKPEAMREPAPKPLADFADLFEAQPEATGAGEEAVQPEIETSRSPDEAMSRSPDDQARAAAHFQAAGRTEAAVERYLAAVRDAAARGDTRRAYAVAGQALELLDGLPGSPRRALLRVELLLETGRLQWHGAMLGASFTLNDALRTLERARDALPKDAPPQLMGELASVTAGICYDLGDLDSLRQALEELTEIGRRLLALGESLQAARLLNDQAAVHVRLGDPVRASHLLSKSRELFEKLLRENPDDPVALAELAETEHLLARLPLHARIRSGRESDAYTLSLDHALAAEGAYRRLGRQRELAHVWESMGRLELGRGRLEAARERLAAALALQKRLGDVSGLARSTAALADLFAVAGHLDEAVSLLADSVALNAEKGSPIGLAFNRRALAALSKAVGRMQGQAREELRAALGKLESQLAQAESVFGQLVLPGESD